MLETKWFIEVAFWHGKRKKEKKFEISQTVISPFCRNFFFCLIFTFFCSFVYFWPVLMDEKFLILPNLDCYTNERFLNKFNSLFGIRNRLSDLCTDTHYFRRTSLNLIISLSDKNGCDYNPNEQYICPPILN